MYSEPCRGRDNRKDTNPDMLTHTHTCMLHAGTRTHTHNHNVPVNVHPHCVVMLGCSPVEQGPNDDQRPTSFRSTKKKCLLCGAAVVVKNSVILLV